MQRKWSGEIIKGKNVIHITVKPQVTQQTELGKQHKSLLNPKNPISKEATRKEIDWCQQKG